MVVNSKIDDSDWSNFTLTIVNFNYVFIQPAPEMFSLRLCMTRYADKKTVIGLCMIANIVR